MGKKQTHWLDIFKIEELNVFLEIIQNDEVEKIQKTIQSFQNSMTQLSAYYGNAYKILKLVPKHKKLFVLY